MILVLFGCEKITIFIIPEFLLCCDRLWGKSAAVWLGLKTLAHLCSTRIDKFIENIGNHTFRSAIAVSPSDLL